ncbi:MAG: hypothetical protein IPN50_07510 [Sphingomonadales bacterium]|nr:hypothetical protein [Sphingomonadales bacterium]
MIGEKFGRPAAEPFIVWNGGKSGAAMSEKFTWLSRGAMKTKVPLNTISSPERISLRI